MGLLRKTFGAVLGWQPPPMTPSVTGREWLSWSSNKKLTLVRSYFDVSVKTLFGLDASFERCTATLDPSENDSTELFGAFIQQFDTWARERPDDARLNQFIFLHLNAFQKMTFERVAQARSGDILGQYGKLLETPSHGILRPESSLPASKEAIKAALIARAREVTRPPETQGRTLDAIRTCYMSLADFVPDDIATKHLTMWHLKSNPEGLEPQQLARRVVEERDPRVDAAMKAWADDAKRLLEEFDNAARQDRDESK